MIGEIIWTEAPSNLFCAAVIFSHHLPQLSTETNKQLNSDNQFCKKRLIET